MFKSMVELFGGASQPQRIAVIDVGSNSVRMVVFLAEARIPTVLFNEKALCGLGAELESTGRLSPGGKAMALASLKRFRELSRRLKVDASIALGTAALRDAEDGPEFVREVAAETGVEIETITGADEARLAAQGVLLGDPAAQGLVADLGGASLELVRVDVNQAPAVGQGVTTPLGALRLLSQLEESARSDVAARIDATIDAALTKLDPKLRSQRLTLYALGGSFRAIASVWMELNEYPVRVLHGYTLPYEAAVKAAETVSKMKPPELRQLAGVSERRALVTPPASLALLRLLKRLKPKELAISAFGLREGAYWEHLTPAFQQADPLLDAAARIEQITARAPGFGDELFEWLRPTLGGFSAEEVRLAHAACRLSDAAWRTHPDYRAIVALELTTRNAFGGVDHIGRVFIGAALLFRHKGGRKAAKMETALSLLSPEALARAEALGRGMRFGAAIAGAAPGVLPELELVCEDDAVELRIPNGAAKLKSDDVQKRLENYAAALGLPARITGP
ncbi:MAG: Ppx/GppA family phosphatase [Neomegalonema sp.]|nr:Ppx/GppA family phosphatase [Neomegalonema sp.]